MSSPIEHEPAASKEILSLPQSVDRLSGLLNPVETEETPREPESPPPTDQAPQEEDDTEDRGTESPDTDVEESQDEPPDDAAQVELEPEQFAELLGIDGQDLVVKDDGSIAIRAKVDGEETRVSLRDLRDSYQLGQAHSQRLSKLGEDRKVFETERQQALEGLTNQYQTMQAGVQALENDYMSAFKAVDWQKLREEDPTEYNLKRNDYEDRRKRVEAHRGAMLARGQELQHQNLAQMAQAQQNGAQKLGEVFSGPEYSTAPQWGDSEQKELSAWIKQQGFSDQDISGVTIWQVFKWARDSMLRQKELKQAKETVKKVARLPKIVKPGTPKPGKEVKREKLEGLKQRQRKTGGSMNASTELIRGILNG